MSATSCASLSRNRAVHVLEACSSARDGMQCLHNCIAKALIRSSMRCKVVCVRRPDIIPVRLALAYSKLMMMHYSRQSRAPATANNRQTIDQ
eukprot:scaffold159266_cov22-Prasinocladus_malaysianus.AAC.1